MLEVGRMCVKIAGRDAGKKAVIVEDAGKNMFLIDGETRRRKCNMLHLEPLNQVIDIKKNASHADIKSAFEKLGMKVLETKPKAKKEKTSKKAPTTKK